jgi:FkbM family methyltransferase
MSSSSSLGGVVLAGRIKSVGRQVIGTHRRSKAVQTLHQLASFVESAYWNEGSNLQLNGEYNIIRKLRQANFLIAFDIGANYGDWLIESIMAWPQCQVHAFEVAPLTFEGLRNRLKRSPWLDRATLNPFGLSDTSGEQTMFYFPEHPDLTCDLSRHEALESIPFEAHLVTGDQYAGEHAIETVDFLKIDVEGAEHRVLKGFAKFLEARKVQCIQFEYGAFATQTRVLLGDYYTLLSQNYWIGKIYPTHVDFKDYHWTMEDFRFANYCCVSKGRSDLRSILA